MDDALLEQMVSAQLGANPAAAQQPAQPAQPAPQAQPAPEKKDTPMDIAITENSPNTEAEKSKAHPFEYMKINVNGKDEVYSPTQIEGIIPRYKDLNYKYQTEYAPIKGSVDFLNKLRSELKGEGLELSDEQLVAVLQESLSTYANKEQTFGAQAPQINMQNNTSKQVIKLDNEVGDVSGMEWERQLNEWEEENAITLPPSMREAMKQSNSMANELASMKAMLESLVSNGAKMTSQAEEALTTAKTESSNAAMTRIGNNLSQAQMKYQLPDEAEQDFFTFVQERGYVLEDLMDPGLTDKLAGDFKSVMQTPELERLKQIQQRRMAYTGAQPPNASPGSVSQAGQNPDEDYFGNLVNSAMSNKNM